MFYSQNRPLPFHNSIDDDSINSIDQFESHESQLFVREKPYLKLYKSLSNFSDAHIHGVMCHIHRWCCVCITDVDYIEIYGKCDLLLLHTTTLIVRRAGLLWSQQDFEWRWSVPLFKCLTVLEFSFILFDLCLLITFFNFIMNYVPIVTFWIFTYHKIWILSIMFCFIWSYWIIYFLACLEVSWGVVS